VQAADTGHNLAKAADDGLKGDETCSLGLEVDPTAFGARGDGAEDDTAAVLAALRYGGRCGGVVVIGPRGRQYLVSPGQLQVELHNVTIRVEGTLFGPSLKVWNPELGSWPRGSCAYGESGCSFRNRRSPEFARSKWALLHLQNSTNITIQGPGVIRAPGNTYWVIRNSQPKVRGYCLLKIEHCMDVRVLAIRIVDSPMYQVVIMHSSAVTLERLRITVSDNALGDSGPHNTDGVSIIASQGVSLRESHIESGDDNVVIKESSKNIHVESLVLLRGKGISIGSLGERTAEQQVVTDVVFRNVTLFGSMHGARIKTWKGSKGLVQNISFDSFSVHDVTFGILIDQDYCPRSQRPEGCPAGPSQAIHIKDVHFRDFTGTYVQEDRRVVCVACSGLHFDNVSLVRTLPPSVRSSPPPVRSLPSRAEALRRTRRGV